MVRLATQIYGVLALVSYSILFYLHGWEIFHPAEGWLGYSILAVFLGLGVVVLSKVTVGQFPWAKDIESEFLAILGPLYLWEVCVLAFTSSVGEEVFFRGVLLPWVGLYFSSIIFGAAHVPASLKLLPWTVFALLMGFLLGGLYVISGSLIPPMVVHATVNGINLYALAEKARQLGLPRVDLSE
jgi:membrane protease YdiL (CAAX protease family)